MTSEFKILVAVGILAVLGGVFYLYSKDEAKDNFSAEEQGSITNSTNAPHVILKTNKGEIEIELWKDKAPNTVANFEKLAAEGFYDGSKFHRVIKDFMIQGGDPLSKDDSQRARWGTGGPGYAFADEINSEKLVRGVFAMANAGPNTNGSQFFIITAAATPWLDGKHTGFGKVVRGMDVVDAIEKSGTGANDQPLENITILQATVK